MTDTVAAPEQRGRIARLTGGAPFMPLLVLFGLNLVDEFDRVAFAALTPEIRDAFNLSDTAIVAVGTLAALLQLAAALPVGYLADRSNRVRISVVAAVLWGAMSVLTGLAPMLWVLVIARFGSGVGRIANEVVHPSLIADLYPRESHPRVYGFHRLANSLGNVGGPIAGVLAIVLAAALASDPEGLGWRATFVVLAIPTFLLLVMAVRLREPKRGESIDPELAAQAEAFEGAVPFGEARRMLFSVPTLRRLWLGAFFLGIGALPIGQILSLFFENVYDYGPAGRGLIQLVFGLGTIVGLPIGARYATRASRNNGENLGLLAIVTGLSFVEFGIGLILMALAPWALLSVFFAFVLSIGLGSFLPPYLSLVGLVSPPRVRSQAYAWALLIYGAGGFTYVLTISQLAEAQGYRVGTTVLSFVVALAGLIGASSHRFVKRDAAQAEATLSTAVRIREELDRPDGRRPLLVCKDVDVAYDQVQVLFGVDLELLEGEIIALLGTNGAGKSTLLKAIAGLVDPKGGAIFFHGRDITHADAVQAAKAGIVVVPGGKAVFPTLTVAEHFKASTWLFTEEDPAEVDRRVQEVLEKFPRLRERWDQMAGNLSGGEQQMLALGMAFVAKPRLLMIDELSLGLAPTVVEMLLEIVKAIHDQGCTIILVEQSVNVALTVAERAYFMEKGEVRFSGPTAELLERGDILRAVFLEGAASVGDGNGGAGKAKAAAQAARRETAAGDVILEVNGLTRRFGGITAVDDVSFTLAEHEILGLIGPNGAGKTTIFDLISGLLATDGGRIHLKGADISGWGPDRRAAHGLGRSFQDALIFPTLTVAENVAIGLERHIETRDHVAALFGLPAIQQSEDDVAWTVDDLIELMNLQAFRNKFVSELSTGTRRIVDLAMAIAHDPDVLLLDEPSSGIAQRETEALGPLLRRIQREAGCAMLVIEHDMPLITAVSDEILALDLGAVVTRGSPQEVMSDQRVISAYLGGDIDVIQRSGGRSATSKSGSSKSGSSKAGNSSKSASSGRRRRQPLKAEKP